MNAANPGGSAYLTEIYDHPDEVYWMHPERFYNDTDYTVTNYGGQEAFNYWIHTAYYADGIQLGFGWNAESTLQPNDGYSGWAYTNALVSFTQLSGSTIVQSKSWLTTADNWIGVEAEDQVTIFVW